MSRNRLELHVDQIRLPPGTVGVSRVRAAIERELARLLAAEPARSGASLDGVTLEVPQGDAETMGKAIARQLHARLARR